MSVGICTATLLADPMSAGPDDIAAGVEAAVDAGFTTASVWAFQLDHVVGRGLDIVCVEAATAWGSGSPADTAAEASTLAETAQQVGADRILAVTMDATLPDMGAARDNLGVVVKAAEQVGAQVCLEFLPWSAVPDLATAWAFVEPLGPNACILLDTWHWVRQPGGPDFDLLHRIPGERISYVQLCDVAPGPPGADLLAEAMSGRLLPGEGTVDFAALKQALTDIGASPYYATEIFNPSIVVERGAKGAAVAMKESGERVT